MELQLHLLIFRYLCLLWFDNLSSRTFKKIDLVVANSLVDAVDFIVLVCQITLESHVLL